MLSDPIYTNRRSDLKGLIGGSPQVAKVYPFSRTLFFAVEWMKAGKLVHTIKGRVVAEYENFGVLSLDPFTGTTRRPLSRATPEIAGGD